MKGRRGKPKCKPTKPPSADSKAPFLAPTTYERRQGTDDSGRDYETKLTAFFALQCATVSDTEDMWVGSNLDQVGALDDIVMGRRTSEGQDIAYLVQLKHQDNPTNITPSEFTKKVQKSDGFSLHKYSRSFFDLQGRIDGQSSEVQSEVTRFLRNSDRIVYALFTNRGVNSNCTFLEKPRDDVLDFLNTSAGSGCVYKFDCLKLKDFDSQFLQQMVLFSNQIHVNDANALIENNVKKIMSSLTNVNFKAVTGRFVSFVETWIKYGKERNSRAYHVLRKSDVINVLTDIVLEPYKLNFLRDPYSFYDGFPKILWNRIMSDKAVATVDADKTVHEFLKQYVASEIRRYCDETKRTWADRLSREVQGLFYQQHKDLNTHTPKIIGNYMEMSLFDVYNCLWFNGRLPVLLKIDDAQGYQNIVRILELSNYALQAIVIKDAAIQQTPITKDVSKFITLADLSGEHKEKILDLPVQLQGRPSAALGRFVDKALHKLLKCSDVIHILTGSFGIGSECQPLPTHFIDRSFCKIVVGFEVFRGAACEVFAIEAESNSGSALTNTLKDWKLTSQLGSAIFPVEKGSFQRMAKEARFKGKSVHRLVFHGTGLLEWKESHGDTKSIRKFQAYRNRRPGDTKVQEFSYGVRAGGDRLKDILESDTADSSSNAVRIVSACAGMGKSTLMDFVALNAPPEVWVLKVTLNEHEDYLEEVECKGRTLTASDHLKHLNASILRTRGCACVELAQRVFQKMLSPKGVLVLLDGFDEVSVLNKEGATQIVQSLSGEGYRVWLTTRPHLQAYLEEKFNTVARTLEPFTEEDQRGFLAKYFAQIGAMLKPRPPNCQELIEEFIQKLLRAAGRNFSDGDREFAGIPLQTKLLADVFGRDLEASLRSGVVAFDDKFDLLYLYEEFIRGKVDILCDKFGKDAKRSRKLFLKYQQLFGLKAVFDKPLLKKLDIEALLEECYRNEEHRQFLQREGVLVVEPDGSAGQKVRFSFVHRTFAEYLAAQWLAEHLITKSDYRKFCWVAEVSLERRFDNLVDYPFLFKVFDCILAQNCDVLLAIINGHTKEAIEIIRDDPDVVNTVKDRCGRIVLHLIPLYAFSFLRDENSVGCNPHVIDILEYIPSSEISVLNEDMLGYNPLDYALMNWSLAVADKICEKSPDPTLNIVLRDALSLQKHFRYCARFKFKFLFKFLFKYGLVKELLGKWSRVKEDTTVRAYCKRLGFEYSDALESYVGEFGAATLSELLESFGIKCPGTPWYWDLRFAVAFGTVDNITELLSRGADAGKQDLYGHTPLHYAFRNNRWEVAETMISCMSQVDSPDRHGKTALHLAADEGKAGIVQLLLSKGAGINRQDSRGETPLLLALQRGHIDLAQLLLHNGADVNAESKSAYPLAYAAYSGNVDVVSELLYKGALVNKQDSFGYTPLMVALQHNHVSTAELLIERGADVNIIDKAGNAHLHWAAEKGCLEVMPSLLPNSRSPSCSVSQELVNIQNNLKETPLHWTVHRSFKHHEDVERQLETVRFLLCHGANINAQDRGGNTVLHHLITYRMYTPLRTEGALRLKDFSAKCTVLLLNKGADVTLKNHMNQTALDLAIQKESTDIVSLLEKNNGEALHTDRTNTYSNYYETL